MPRYLPNHIPWIEPTVAPPRPWVAEGSIVSTHGFRSRYSEIRHRPYNKRANDIISASQSIKENQGFDQSSAFGHLSASPSFREALIFKREVTVQTDSHPRQCSIQVPAKSMNSDMANLVLELDELRSFFEGDTNHTDKRIILSQGTSTIPTVVISNSKVDIPLSLDSSPNLTQEIPLAIRRGKNVPPPLAPKAISELDYPGFPSAFMGSPTNYSPKFDHSNGPDNSSMDCEEMIARLKTQSLSLGNRPKVEIPPATRVSMATFDDEWAFADTLMGSYSDCGTSLGSATFCDATEIRSCQAEIFIPDSNSPTAHLPCNAKKLVTTLTTGKYQKYVTPPPSRPLPSRPALSPRKNVRGILKGTKCVRFASLAHEDSEKTLVLTPIIKAPAVFDQDQRQGCTCTPSQTGVSPPIAPLPRLSARSTSESVAPSRNCPTVPHKLGPQALESISRMKGSSLSKHAQQDLGRHSVSGKSGKENRLQSSSFPLYSIRNTVDENILSRGKKRKARDEGTQRSRMPVSVRNIFTRFK